MLHGPAVEVGDGFACEAVWPDRFADGDFDREAIVAGSGVRARENEAVFVSATSAIDRLHSIERPEGPLVSNSLPCLLRAVGVEARFDYWRYQPDLETVMRGLGRHRPTLPTTGPPVRLTYFRNLVWAGAELRERDKPLEPAGFGDFDEYRAFLLSGLEGIAENMASVARRHPYTMLGTVSSGYDGAAVTALAAEVGCREALTFDESRLGEPDSGEPVARALGLEPIIARRATWRRQARKWDPLYEAPFFAAMPSGGLAPFGAVRDDLAARVLITGFYGGWIWNPDPADLNPLARHDFSGLTFTEFRLGAGFINCDPSSWAARQIADVVAISRSREMIPWLTGSGYQKPIARRIVEEAGVPREAFGLRKQPGVGASLLREAEFLGPESLADYRAWVRRRVKSLGTGRLLTLAAIDCLSRGTGSLAGAVLRSPHGRGAGGRLRRRVERLAKVAQPLEYGVASRLFTFQWALSRVGDRYPFPPDEP